MEHSTGLPMKRPPKKVPKGYRRIEPGQTVDGITNNGTTTLYVAPFHCMSASFEPVKHRRKQRRK